MRKTMVLSLMMLIAAAPAMPSSVDPISVNEDSVAAMEPGKESKRETALREKLQMMGPGAEIRVVLRDSSAASIQGVLHEINSEAFILKVDERLEMYPYSRLMSVALRKRDYQKDGLIDPVRLRQILADWGVGQKIRIGLSNKNIDGRIQTVNETGVTIIDNKTGERRAVAFSEIQKVQKKGFPVWGTAAIAAGAAVGLLAALMYAHCGSGGCH